MFDHLFIDAHLATMEQGSNEYGAIENGALGVRQGKIEWVGRQEELPDTPEKLAKSVSAHNGAWITPGLIDCHTHLVFAGDRANEFEMRLNGARYEEIANAGGGIRSTVKATRAASLDELVASALPRIKALHRGGVTTVEIKSGYGLDTKTEIRMLEAASRLQSETGLRIKKTFLGLHALPPEYADDRAAYIDLICQEMLPQIAKRSLADAVDGFCEGIGFSPAEVEAVFSAAQSHKLPVKLHAEQLSNLGGAKLAAKFSALSADHLEYIDEAGVAAMAEANMVAVLLPGAFYMLNEKQRPPVNLFRKHNVSMALATDLNPGSAPVLSPTLMMNMGAVLFGMTPEETLAGMTCNAAKALGIQDEVGTLARGKAADLAIWDVSRPAELSYWIGLGGPREIYARGEKMDLSS